MYYQRYNHRYEYEDIFQTGCIGLVKAVNNFDESRGYKFITYAYPLVKGEICRYIQNDKWFLAKNRKERLYKTAPIGSLDVCVGEKEDTPLVDFISAEDRISSFDLHYALRKLSKDLFIIIKLKYFYGYSQKEIGNMMGITQVQISRREKAALKNLRKEMMA